VSTFKNSVSINPYFRITEANRAACNEMLTQFCELVSSEAGCLFYNFTFNNDVLCCREAYTDAAAVAAHLENCGAALGQFVQIAELFRIEVHGPAEELDKLRETFASMNPEYFILDCGVAK